MITLSEPFFGGNEWEYVKQCLDSGWVSSAGEFVDRFETQLSGYLGGTNVVACTSGTAALHIAAQLAGLQPDEEVLVPTLTFIAPVNVVRYCGAHPVFMDCEPEYFNLDVGKVAEFIQQECRFEEGVLRNKTTGRRIRMILPVHLFGHPVDMDPLMDLARTYRLSVVEDASQALGAKYKGQPVGTMGDFGCLSFNGNKIITTGGGGALLTNNEALATQARYLTIQAKDDGVFFIHNNLGYNYRLTSIAAALGCAQLEQLDDFIAKKRANLETYLAALTHVPDVELISREAPWAFSTYWLYTIRLLKAAGDDTILRDRLINRLSGRGVQTRPFWRLNHLQTPYENCQTYRIENALRLYNTCLNIPSSVNLGHVEIDKVKKSLQTAL